VGYHPVIRLMKCHIEDVADGPPAEEFDAEGEGCLILVSRDKEEDVTFVGLSYLVPRIYALWTLAGMPLRMIRMKGRWQGLFSLMQPHDPRK